jgi:hypothetical protein
MKDITELTPDFWSHHVKTWKYFNSYTQGGMKTDIITCTLGSFSLFDEEHEEGMEGEFLVNANTGEVFRFMAADGTCGIDVSFEKSMPFNESDIFGDLASVDAISETMKQSFSLLFSKISSETFSQDLEKEQEEENEKISALISEIEEKNKTELETPIKNPDEETPPDEYLEMLGILKNNKETSSEENSETENISESVSESGSGNTTETGTVPETETEENTEN